MCLTSINKMGISIDGGWHMGNRVDEKVACFELRGS